MNLRMVAGRPGHTLLRLFLLWGVLFWTGLAWGGLPSYAERARSLADALLDSPEAPEALYYLDDLQSLAGYLDDPDLVIRTCTALAARRLPVEMRVAVELCRLSHARTMGDEETVAAQRVMLGVVDRYRIIGPFDNEGGSGMNTAYGPEAEYDPLGSCPGKQGPVFWRDLPSCTTRIGKVDFSLFMEPGTQSLAYAAARIGSSRAQKALLLVTLAGEGVIWLNGTKVYATDGIRRLTRLQDAIPVMLAKGTNDLLVKSGATDGPWSFRLALLGPDGRPLTGVTGLRRDEDEAQAPAFPDAAMPVTLSHETPPSPLLLGVDILKARDVRTPNAELALSISRLLKIRGNYAVESRQSEEWADRALERDPDAPKALLWCNGVYRDVNRRHACLTKGLERYPEDPRFRVRLAGFYAREGLPLAARRLLEPALDHPGVDIEAQGRMVDLESSQGDQVGAFLRVQALTERHPNSDRAASRLLKWLERMDRPENMAAQASAMLNRQPGHALALSRLFDYHLGRRELDQALSILDHRIRLRPWDLDLYLLKAWILDGMERPEEVRAVLEKVLTIAPDHTRTIEELAQLEHRLGNETRALDLFARSLEIRPQNPELTQYLQFLAPDTDRFDAPYIEEVPSLIAQYPPLDDDTETAEVLLDLAVWKVFENGLSSEFHQQVVRVRDDKGVKSFKSFTVGYSPGRQSVKILQARVFKPDGSVVETVHENDFSIGASQRMYYDRRATAVSFPDLKPGDVVEFQYRLDDTGGRNLFADYFGAMRLLQIYVPTRRWETVILMPPTRPLYHNTPVFAPQPVVDDVDGLRRYVWRAEETPKIPQEPSAPGLIEVADFLHVSTFKDWDAMSRWYWGLIKDQFIAKEELRQKVAELVAGTDDPRERIRILHEWVVRNTRYVALEFGIHSFKPYQVNQIFQRRFGDCKDKATLLITMLKEAGVDAVMAIIRTSNMGRLPTPYPPSLAMFNHAIVYIPAYDLYLDGTAEFAGMDALPYQDRRGQVVLVGPELAVFTQVPPVEPENNRRDEVSQIRLDTDGQATATVKITLTGNGATTWRARFQDAERRREILEKNLNQENPGAELLDLSFEGMDDINAPVVVRYTARLPKFSRPDGAERAVWAHLDRVDLVTPYATLASREHPVEIPRLDLRTWRTELILPEGVTVNHFPDPVERKNPAGSFSARMHQEGPRIVIEGHLRFTAHTVSPDAYPAFREFCQDVTRSFREELRLSHERHD